MAKASTNKVLTTIHASPAKFRLVESLRGRSQPVADDDIVALADSIRTRGLEQPVRGRAVEGTDEYETVFGNNRVRAGMLILNGYKSGDKEIPADPTFKLRAEIGEFSDEEAFVSNVIENAQRMQCSPIDNMRNQERLRTEFDMSDAAIARLYGQDNAWVNRLKKLQVLPEHILNAIHAGTMSTSAGFMLSGAKDVLEKNAIDTVWALIKADGEDERITIGSTQVAAALKEWRKAQKPEVSPSAVAGTTKEEVTGEATGEVTGEATVPETSTYIPLTFKQVKDVFKVCAEGEGCPPKTKQLSQYSLDLMTGKLTDREYVKAIMELLGEEPVKVTPPAEGEATPPAEGEATPPAPGASVESQEAPQSETETPADDSPVNDPPASEHTVERPAKRRHVKRG